jgi:hypothetical protein
LSVKREIWDLGYNYFEEGIGNDTMGRLCFGKHWQGGILKKWPKYSSFTSQYNEM